MKKFLVLIVTLALFAGCKRSVIVDSQDELLLKKASLCVTIQSGTLTTSTGEIIKPGYMENGYNYQAHIYNGEYAPGWNLVMKWNDAWLSNQDCNGDGKLDRPTDNGGSYKGSGAWLTNHWTNVYQNNDGIECTYDEFTKIVAVPVDAELKDGYYYNADGTQIGEAIWGDFAIVEYVVNDPCGGTEGVQYKSPDHPGLGNW